MHPRCRVTLSVTLLGALWLWSSLHAWIQSSGGNDRPGITGLLYPFNDDSFLAPGNNQKDGNGDLKFDVDGR